MDLDIRAFLATKKRKLKEESVPVSLSERRAYQRDQIMGLCRLFKPTLAHVDDFVREVLQNSQTTRLEPTESRKLMVSW